MRKSEMFECCREKIRIAADLLGSLSGEVLRVHLSSAVVSDEVSHCLSTDRDGLSLHAAVRCRLHFAFAIR
jgi:hypothetical protein